MSRICQQQQGHFICTNSSKTKSCLSLRWVCFSLISSMSLGDVTVSQSFADLAHAGTVPALLSVSLIKAAVKLL